MFSRFDAIHACDRWTDGWTDGIGMAYARYSIYAVARKKFNELFECYRFLVKVLKNAMVITAARLKKAVITM